MAYQAGTAFLQIVPSFRFIDREIKQGLDGLARQFGKSLDDTLPGVFTDSTRRAARTAEPELKTSGRGAAGVFATAFHKRIEAAFKALPAVELTADSSDAERAVHAVRTELTELHGKRIGIDIDEVHAMAALFDLERRLKEITDANVSVEVNAGADKARREIRKFFDDVRTEAQETADAAAKAAAKAAERTQRAADEALRKYEEQQRLASGRVAETWRKRLSAAAAALPRVELTPDFTDVDKAVHAARAEAQRLGNLHIGVDIDEVPALAQALRLMGELRKITDANVSVKYNTDADAAHTEIDRFFTDVRTQAQREAQKTAKAAADAAAREAAKAAREALAAARRQDEQRARDAAKAAEQEAKLAADAFARTFAGRVQTVLRNATQRLPVLTIDADSTDAERAIAGIRERLAELASKRIGIDIDEATALAEIRALKAQLADLDRRRTNVQLRVDAASGVRELAEVDVLVKRLNGRKARIEIDADNNRALRALSGLGDATEVNLSRLGTLISVGASLGTAIVPAAAAATTAIGFIGTAAAASTVGVGVLVLGFSGISDAVTALSAAHDAAATSSASLSRADSQVAGALDQVTTAERNLASVRASNGDSARRAARDVEQAELSLADAQLAEKRAQLDLTAARQEARRVLEDLSLSIEDNALRQRQATLDVAAAKENLDKLIANPRATDAEREQATITYEQALQQQKQLGVQQQRLEADRKAADKAGVDGSAQVQAAQDRIAASARQVADSQRRLSDSIAAQTAQQRQGAKALADAQQQVVSAQRALARAYTSAGVAGGSSIDNVRAAMEKLSPTGQRFARWLFGLTDEFYRLRGAASDGLLSGVQKAVTGLLPGLPRLTRFIGEVSDTLGDLAGRAVAELKDPTFRQLFTYIETTAVPTITTLFTAGMNIARGLVGLFLAFTPLTGDVSHGLLDITKRFADWATTLDRNPAFQSFLAYAKDNAPLVLDLLKQMAVTVLRLVEAAAPTGTFVVEAFAKLFEWINKIPIDVLETLVAAIGGAAAGLTAFAAITAAIALDWAGVIVAGIAAIVAGLVILYQKVPAVRAAFDAVWQAIVVGATYTWQQVLEPIFTAIGAAAEFLWTNVLHPLAEVFATDFTLIANVVQWWWGTIVKPVFAALSWWITNVTAPILRWLYTAVVKPIFDLIGVAFKIGGALFQVLAGLWQISVKIVAGIVSDWYHQKIEPILVALRIIFKALGSVIEKDVAPGFRKGLGLLSAVFAVFADTAKVPIRFLVETVLNDGLLAGYNKLAKAFKVDPHDVHIDLPKSFDKPSTTARADGGILPGYTPGRDVHTFVSPRTGARLHLSGGEAIIRPEGTTVLGPGWVDGINRAARTGGISGVQDFLATDATNAPARTPGSGDGLGDLLRAARDKAGDVLSGLGSILRDPAGVMRRLADKLIGLIPGTDSVIGQAIVAVPKRVAQGLVDDVTRLFTGDDGAHPAAAGGIGSAQMMRILHGPFPDLRLISGYRPKAVTVTGHESYHAKKAANGEKGRAVDVPPLMEVFNWIHDAFPKSPELIFTPAGPRQIHNGHPHVYTGAVAAEHYHHVHWALRHGGILPTLYDDGGYLPPGLSVVANGTSRPEPVFTDGQWQQLAAASRHPQPRAGAQYQFTFRDSTLTPARLRALQDREDALNRVHRTR